MSNIIINNNIIDENNFQNELNQLSLYINKNTQTMINLIKFFQEIYLKNLNYYQSINNIINSFFDEKKLLESQNQLEQNLNFFYQITLIYLKNFKENLIENFNNKIIIPLNEEKKIVENNNNILLNSLKTINNRYKEIKKDLLKIQKKYFISCKNLSNNNLINNYFKYKNKNDLILYKYQIKNSNNIYNKININYDKYLLLLRDNEKKRLNFFKNLFNNYNMINSNYINNFNEYNIQIKNKFDLWNIENDINSFNEDFNFYNNNNNNNNRIKMEEVINYNNNNENILNEKLKYFNINNNNFSYIYNKFFNNNNINYKEENNQKIIIETFIKILDNNNNEELSLELICLINNLIIEDKNFSTLFLKLFIDSHKNLINNINYHQIYNLNNFYHFSNILKNILYNFPFFNLNSNDNDNNNNDFICNLSSAIIFISQRTFYYDLNSNKILFLSGIISKDSLFQKYFFWKNIIEFKLKIKLNAIKKKISIFIQEDKIKGKKYNNNNNKNNNINFKKNEFVLLIDFTNFEKIENNYQIYFIENSKEQLKNILFEIIPSFINFNFDLSNSNNLISNICNRFNIDNEYLNHYINYLNINKYSVKKIYNLKHDDYNNKINFIINSKNNHNKINNNIIKDNSINNNLNLKQKLIILKSSIKYLPFSSLISLLLLSKEFTIKLKKTVYKYILNTHKNIPIKTHINIWKILLQTSKIQSQYNYNLNKEKANNIEYDKLSNCDYNIIDLDCQRTQFENNNEENKKKMNNILKTFAFTLPDINYCQGMNFIIAFFLKFIENEEEIFYLFLSMFVNTNFSKIFYKDLIKLNNYLEILNKLIEIFLPVVYIHLKNNKINNNFYASAWLITLFTNTMIKNKNIKVLIKIFDCFFCDEWKFIFNLILLLFKKNQNKILSLKNENLMKFLNNEIYLNDFYNEDEKILDNFILEIGEIKFVKNELINNIKKFLYFEEREKERKKVLTNNNNNNNNN